MDWLSIPEQALLSVTRGEVFRDDLGQLAAVRQALAWFPRDVWLFKLGCAWARVAEETAFVGRCGDVGDDLDVRSGLAGELLLDGGQVVTKEVEHLSCGRDGESTHS